MCYCWFCGSLHGMTAAGWLTRLVGTRGGRFWQRQYRPCCALFSSSWTSKSQPSSSTAKNINWRWDTCFLSSCAAFISEFKSGNGLARFSLRFVYTVFVFFFRSVEGLWLPLGPADGGVDAGCVFSDGLAMVRSGDCAVYFPRQQSKTGIRKLCPRRAATIPGDQRTETNWAVHFPAHGLLSVYDWCFTGTS